MNNRYHCGSILHSILRLFLYPTLFTLPVITSAGVPKKTVMPKGAAEVVKPVKENRGRVNINQASAEELATQLKGIGQKRAQAIVEYRKQQGLFINIEQLVEVPGISPLIVEQNRDRLTV